ncbi:MAG: polysaccharide deacetylase family protein [Desulfobacterales bacterium]|nr:polysaccharide deacetylase family protein [Desulfobacterales bacterium]
MRTFIRHLIESFLGKIPYRGIIIGNHTQGTRQVRDEVEALAPYFDFVHHNQLPRRMRVKKQKPFCLFTFDDGKKINAVESAAELERFGIPAVFYIVTNAVSHNSPLWVDRRNAIIKYLGKTPDVLRPEVLKNKSILEINTQLDLFFSEYPVKVALDDPCVASMCWEDVKRLDKKGFTIGAHTKTHPILTNELKEDATREIAGSIDRVTAELGYQCPSFAFPNGNYSEELALYAMNCGVKSIMTTTPLWVGANADLGCLPRVDIYNHYDRRKIWLKLTAALPGCLLKHPNGTGRQYVWKRVFKS